MMNARATIAISTLLLAGCSPASPTPQPPDASATAAAVTASVPPVSATAAASAKPDEPIGPKPVPCGELGCLLFETPEQAFREVLARDPKVVAIGEAHAQKGTEHIPSSTRRFTEQLLPLLKDRASDLVIELMKADGKCRADEKKVADTQKPVTDKQAAGNQNEFLMLGNKSKSLGIRPHVLRPGCKDYKAVVKAGPDGIARMLEMIAALTEQLTKRILDRNARESVDKIVIAYGGAMHNDLQPREGREKWSFGPQLATATSGRYVEVDLIVPEFIKDNNSWRALPWYAHFDRTKHPSKVTLFNTGKDSYVLIFAATKPAK